MAAKVEIFAYPESADAPFVPSWAGWDMAPDTGQVQERSTDAERICATQLSDRIAEESMRSFEAGRLRGIEEGRSAERAAHASANSAAREEQIRFTADLVAGFERQKSEYFRAVEQNVVRLAIAVAGRILRREAVMDPLLLIGSVRVALGQIAASTDVRLRVPSEDLELWTEAIELLPNLKSKPQVSAGEGMRVGECVIETELGHADLSVPRQLAEIERSIMQIDPQAESAVKADKKPARGPQ